MDYDCFSGVTWLFREKNSSQNRNSYQKVALPRLLVFQHKPLAALCLRLWWPLSPQTKGRTKQMEIIDPQAQPCAWPSTNPQGNKTHHTLTTPGPLLSSGSGMEVAARLLWGTRTNMYFKYEQWMCSKVDFSHLSFRGERGAALVKGQCGI